MVRVLAGSAPGRSHDEVEGTRRPVRSTIARWICGHRGKGGSGIREAPAEHPFEACNG